MNYYIVRIKILGGGKVTLGQYLKELREGKELSLREVARRSNMSSSYLSQLENGHNNNPKKEILKELSRVLDAPYVELMYRAGYIPELIYKQWESDYIKDKYTIDKNKLDLNKEKISNLRDDYARIEKIPISPSMDENKKQSLLREKYKEIQKAGDDNFKLAYKLKNHEYDLLNVAIEYAETEKSLKNYKFENDLKEFLNSNTDIYYNGKKLTDENRDKILTMLEIIL